MKAKLFAAAMIVGVSGVSIAAGPQGVLTGQSVNQVVTQKFRVAPQTPEFQQFLEWIVQRQRESREEPAEFSSERDFNLSVISVEIVTKSRVPRGREVSPSETGPGGVILPASGTAGQKITITDCQAGQYKEVATYEWIPNGNYGGHWQRVDYSKRVSNAISCPAPDA